MAGMGGSMDYHIFDIFLSKSSVLIEKPWLIFHPKLVGVSFWREKEEGKAYLQRKTELGSLGSLGTPKPV